MQWGETRRAKINMLYCGSLGNFRSLWQKSCLSELLITSIGEAHIVCKKEHAKTHNTSLVLHLESLFRYSKTYWSEKEKKDPWNSSSLNDVGHFQTKRERLTCTAWPGTMNTAQNNRKPQTLGPIDKNHCQVVDPNTDLPCWLKPLHQSTSLTSKRVHILHNLPHHLHSEKKTRPSWEPTHPSHL